jgi:hypothetical protein
MRRAELGIRLMRYGLRFVVPAVITSPMNLFLSSNSDLTNVQPLLDNTGLGAGERAYLQSTSVSCGNAAMLGDKGVTVRSTGCP